MHSAHLVSRKCSSLVYGKARELGEMSDDFGFTCAASGSAAGLPSFRTVRPPRRLLFVTLRNHMHPAHLDMAHAQIDVEQRETEQVQDATYVYSYADPSLCKTEADRQHPTTSQPPEQG